VAAAQWLAPRYVYGNECLRIDVLLLAPGRWPRHIVNASMLLD
jgi:putative endonuclease